MRPCGRLWTEAAAAATAQLSDMTVGNKAEPGRRSRFSWGVMERALENMTLGVSDADPAEGVRFSMFSSLADDRPKRP